MEQKNLLNETFKKHVGLMQNKLNLNEMSGTKVYLVYGDSGEDVAHDVVIKIFTTLQKAEQFKREYNEKCGYNCINQIAEMEVE
jgi:hypothetical protein